MESGGWKHGPRCTKVACVKASLTPEPTPPRRLAKRKLERRLRIYDAAVDLFRSQGFERTTVSQIAEAADVVPATFFNHFPSKNAVLGQMAGDVVGVIELILKVQLAAADSTRERLIGFTKVAAEQIAQTRGLARDVLLELMRTESEPGKQPPYLGRIHDPFAAMLREGQERGDVRSDQDPAFLAEMVVGVLNAAITNWLANADYPIEQRLPQAAHFAWEAIAASRA